MGKVLEFGVGKQLELLGGLKGKGRRMALMGWIFIC